MSVDFTILHNPRCSTSRAALENLEASDRSFEVVPYLKQPLTVDQLRDLVALFPHSPTDLVRRDPNFAKLGLTDDDVRTPDQVVTALAEHPELLQRPIQNVAHPNELLPEITRDQLFLVDLDYLRNQPANGWHAALTCNKQAPETVLLNAPNTADQGLLLLWPHTRGLFYRHDPLERLIEGEW